MGIVMVSQYSSKQAAIKSKTDALVANWTNTYYKEFGKASVSLTLNNATTLPGSSAFDDKTVNEGSHTCFTNVDYNSYPISYYHFDHLEASDVFQGGYDKYHSISISYNEFTYNKPVYKDIHYMLVVDPINGIESIYAYLFHYTFSNCPGTCVELRSAYDPVVAYGNLDCILVNNYMQLGIAAIVDSILLLGMNIVLFRLIYSFKKDGYAPTLNYVSI
jgi:hypothetical protein